MNNYGHKALLDQDVTNARDFSQYYRGTSRFFGWRSKLGTVVPAQLISAPDNDDGMAMLRFMALGAYQDVPVSMSQVYSRAIFGTPMLGNAPFGASYLSLSRKAERDSSKGLGFGPGIRAQMLDQSGFGTSNLCSILKKTSRVTSVGLAEFDSFRVLPGANIHIFGLAAHYYSPAFLSIEEGLTRMLSGDLLGVPLSHKLGFHFIRKHPYIGLFLDENEIGEIIDESPNQPTIRIHRQQQPLMRAWLHSEFGESARIIQ